MTMIYLFLDHAWGKYQGSAWSDLSSGPKNEPQSILNFGVAFQTSYPIMSRGWRLTRLTTLTSVSRTLNARYMDNIKIPGVVSVLVWAFGVCVSWNGHSKSPIPWTSKLINTVMSLFSLASGGERVSRYHEYMIYYKCAHSQIPYTHVQTHNTSIQSIWSGFRYCRIYFPSKSSQSYMCDKCQDGQFQGIAKSSTMQS